MNEIFGSLVEYEEYRSSNSILLPSGSNFFISMMDGVINLYTENNDPDEYSFKLFTDSGTVYTGSSGTFYLSNAIKSYISLAVIPSTSLIIDNCLCVDGGRFTSYGDTTISDHSKLELINGAVGLLNNESTLYIGDGASLVVDDSSSLVIESDVSVHLNEMDALLNNTNIFIDPMATVVVRGLDDPSRTVDSLIDYSLELGEMAIHQLTQSEKNLLSGKVGYKWTGGDSADNSHTVQLLVISGDIVFGDFRLSVLGVPNIIDSGEKSISSMYVEKGSTLFVCDNYDNAVYYRPEIYLAGDIDTCTSVGALFVEGEVIVSGADSRIIIDEDAFIEIVDGGVLTLTDDASIVNTTAGDRVAIVINGTLIINTIEQLISFSDVMIEFGENGKVIILNDTVEANILLSIPNGIKDSYLYKLFYDDIDHIEYHIRDNSSILIDSYFSSYDVDMSDWICGMRLEKAIYKGIIKFYDDATIILDSTYVEWVSVHSTLLDVVKLFKTFGSYDSDHLQYLANALKYAGCGNIRFLFKYDTGEHDCTLVIDGLSMIGITYNANNELFTLQTDNSGSLFLKNSLTDPIVDEIIVASAQKEKITDNTIDFSLK